MKLTYEKLPYQEEAVSAVINTLSGHDETNTALELEPEMLDSSVRLTLAENRQALPDKDYLETFPQFNVERQGQGKRWFILKRLWSCTSVLARINLSLLCQVKR